MKILIAIDGSPCSDVVVAEVGSWPWHPQSEVRVVTVDAPINPRLLSSGPATLFDEVVKKQRAESSMRLRDTAALLAQKTPGLQVTTSLLEGWPQDAIVAEAERWGADLVVVGSHGYGPIRRFFLGSVSLYVAHHASCSVLIVRQPPQISAAGNTPATVMDT